MESITIKKVTLNDIEQLQNIGKQTFYETFSGANTEENMTKYLEEGFSTEKLVDELNNSNSEFYIATIENRVVGYLKLNFGHSQTELQDDKAVEIERIYVLKELHGKKLDKNFIRRQCKFQNKKMLTMFDWAFGRKIQGR